MANSFNNQYADLKLGSQDHNKKPMLGPAKATATEKPLQNKNYAANDPAECCPLIGATI